MKSTLNIVTLHYQPTDNAIKAYEGLKRQSDCLFVSSHPLDGGEWSSKNVSVIDDSRIAELNPHLNELTSWWYAYENHLIDKYDEVQVSHYRKWIDADVSTWKHQADIITAKPYPMCFRDQFGNIRTTNIEEGTRLCHPQELWDFLEMQIQDYDEASRWSEWKNLYAMPHPMNLFRMPTILFKEYFEWMFPRIMRIHDMIDYSKDEYCTLYQSRACAFCAERLTSFYIHSYLKPNHQIVEVKPTIHKDFKPITDEQERSTSI